jgi:hypothetical protein
VNEVVGYHDYTGMFGSNVFLKHLGKLSEIILQYIITGSKMYQTDSGSRCVSSPLFADEERVISWSGRTKYLYSVTNQVFGHADEALNLKTRT